MNIRIVLLATSFALAIPSGGQAQPAPVAAATEATAFLRGLDSLVESLRGDFGEFGMAIAVIENGRIVTDRYYGFSDRQRHVPMSRSTLVNVASISKAVSAIGILRLADRGLIDLDAPVFRRITRWRLPDSQYSADGVTAARLLSHTAGISRHTTGTWTVNDRLPTLEAALSGDNGGYGDTRLIHEPGTRWSYSGGGYSILQLLTEEVTGQSFTDYMNGSVLPALGIRNSTYGWPSRTERVSTTYYDEFGRVLPAYRTIELAAGGFNANVSDLARFALAFSRVRNGATRPVLSRALFERMLTPMPAAEMRPGIQFGLGVMLHQLPDGRTLISHDGGNPGSGGYFAINPVTGNGIAILVNRSWAHQVFQPIACAWRNSTAAPGSPPQPCDRDAVGILVNVLNTQGLPAAQARYESLFAEAPARDGEQAILRITDQLGYAERYADAIALLRWHLARNPRSAPVHSQLGEAFFAAGDRAAARAAWEESLRINGDQPEVRRRLEEATR